VNSSEFLLRIFWKAADEDAAFAQYLYARIKERIDSGRAMDCDEYRSLHALAHRRACTSSSGG
jgi:hypothetical protein